MQIRLLAISEYNRKLINFKATDTLAPFIRRVRVSVCQPWPLSYLSDCVSCADVGSFFLEEVSRCRLLMHRCECDEFRDMMSVGLELYTCSFRLAAGIRFQISA